MALDLRLSRYDHQRFSCFNCSDARSRFGSLGSEYTPSYERIRAGLAATSYSDSSSPGETHTLDPRPKLKAHEHLDVLLHLAATTGTASSVRRQDGRARRDSVWNGLLMGAAIGGGGGYLWAREICGSNDTECFTITAPVGVLCGAGIGAAVGAIAAALTR
jgi:hypothetical protein